MAYRDGKDRSDLLILDATRIDKGPVATVHVPHRVPMGFHGSWADGIRESPRADK